MRRFALLLLTLLLLMAAPLSTHAQATGPAAEPAADGKVHAVLFWMTTCPHCHIVIDETLPPLQQQYGDQLDIFLLEVSGPEYNDVFMAAAEHYGVAGGRVGVPFMIIGEYALFGSQQIPAELPGLIDMYLANGGVAYPNVPGLAEVLPEQNPATTAGEAAGPALPATEAAAAATPASSVSGYGLALALMALMVVALLGAGVAIFLGKDQARQSSLALRANKLVPWLAGAGMIVAGYLAYVETLAVPAICGPVGDCNAVQQSEYAKLFGFLPIGVVGLGGYALLLGLWFWEQRGGEQAARRAALLIFGLATAGTLFSLYLTYLEPFVIGAVCMWCLSSAAIITLLMLASLGPARQALAPAPVQQQRKGRGGRGRRARA
jgi:uncharacterized membrane protein